MTTLILPCGVDQKIVDNDPDSYTVEGLSLSESLRTLNTPTIVILESRFVIPLGYAAFQR